jgi:glucokinase
VTTIESDVRAAARAEAEFGAGKGRRGFVYVTIGPRQLLPGHPMAAVRGPTASPFISPRARFTSLRGCGHLNARPRGDRVRPAISAAYARRTGRRVSAPICWRGIRRRRGCRRHPDRAARQLGPLIALVVNMLDPEVVVSAAAFGLARTVS